MTRSLLNDYRLRLAFKNGVILLLSLLCLLATIRPGAAAGMTVRQSHFAPAPIKIGQAFAFSFDLDSTVAEPNAIIVMDIRSLAGNLLLQKYYSGQNVTVGQTTAYSWSGTIPSGPSLSIPFASGNRYNLTVAVYNSNFSAQYMASTIATVFSVYGSVVASPPTITGTPVKPPVVTPPAVASTTPPPVTSTPAAPPAATPAAVVSTPTPPPPVVSTPAAPPVVTPPTVASNSPAAPTTPIPPPTASTPASAPNVGYLATAPIPPPVGMGKTYYVSDPTNAAVDKANRALLPSGATIFTTLQAAANVTQPGDTVLVMNGTYEPNPAQWVVAVLYVTTSGSATGGYITYAAYPGAHPVITISNSVNTWDTVALSASYIVFKGFEVTGSAQNVTLAFANQETATGDAAMVQEAAAGQYAHTPSSTAKNQTNGSCIASSDVTHVIVVNNLVHDCSAAGIDFETCDYTTIEANTVYNTSWWTIYDTSGIDIHLALNSDSATGYKNYVLDNISYHNANTQRFMYDDYDNDVTPGSHPTAPTDGNGIIIDTNRSTNNGSPYLGRTLVAGNLSYGNGGSGIHAYLSNHVDIINNTAYLNDTCPVAGSTCGPAATVINGVTVSGNTHGQIYSMSGSDVNIYNNIMVAPAGKYVSTNYNNTNVVENNNILFSLDGGNLLGGYRAAAKDILANPQFANSVTPAINNFVLSASSPGIAAGIVFNKSGVSVPVLLDMPALNGPVNIGAAQ